MSPSLTWTNWKNPIPEWWSQLSIEEKGGDLWIKIGDNITESQARHLYSQWFLGRGWATPPTEQENLPKPYWHQYMRWKIGQNNFDEDETTWLQLDGEEGIRRIWTLKGDWAKNSTLPNPSSCHFSGFDVFRVTRETPLLPLRDDDFDITAYYFQDTIQEETTIPGKEPEWDWINNSGDIQLEWTQEYVFPFHVKPSVELRLRETRHGSASEFWVHHRQGPFFQQVPTRELWVHIPWKVADGQNITPNSRGRKSRSLVNPDKLHWNVESILSDLSVWITSLLQDLQGTYILSSKSDLMKVQKDLPDDIKIPKHEILTRQLYHDTPSLSEWVAQEDIKGENGLLWVSRIEGQQEMLWWFGENKAPVSLGWLAEGWAGSLWEGVLVGNQQTLYLRDTLFYKNKDIRDLPFQINQAPTNSRKKVAIQDRWSVVQEVIKDMTKKGSNWHNIPDLDPEWRIMIQSIPSLVSAKVVWDGVPEEERVNKEPLAWFVGEWIQSIEKESGKPVGLSPGPLTAGQRIGLIWRSSSDKYAKTPIIQWNFPSMMRVIAKINLVKNAEGFPVVKQTEKLVQTGVMGKGGSSIEYQPYVLSQLEVHRSDSNDSTLELWRPRGAPAESGVGVPAGDGNTANEGGAFQVGIPIMSGVMASYMVNGARGDLLRDGDIVLWELDAWTGLDKNIFPWRPVARMPRGDEHRISTNAEIQGMWELFRAPINETNWKEGRVPENDPLPVPLPGANEIPTGDVMPIVKTIGEQENAIEVMEEASKTKDQNEEYYVKREGARAKLPWSYFHNQIVKRILYREVAPAWADLVQDAGKENILNIRRPMQLEPQGLLVELASGEAHDYTKWSESAFQNVIGIEKYEVAVERSYEAIRDFAQTYRGYKPRCEFIWGDMTKLIFPNRDASEDEIAKERLAELLPVKYMADVVAVQFALHYAAGNELDLRRILLNISDNLQLGGYFISTFFDAEKVNALLKASKNGKANGIRVGPGGEQEWSWQIQRSYQPSKWGATKLNLGQAINVFVSSIGHSHEEFLVPMKTLTDFANEVGLEMIEVKSFESMWMNVPRTNKHYNEIRKMSEAEKTFSFLNQAVIFQKTKKAPDSAYTTIRKLEAKAQKKKETKKTNSETELSVESQEEIKQKSVPTEVKAEIKEINLNEEEEILTNVKPNKTKSKKNSNSKKDTTKTIVSDNDLIVEKD